MKSLGSLKFFDNYKKNELFYNLFTLTILFFLNCFMGEMSYLTFSFLLVIVLMADMSNGFTYIVYSIPFCLIGQEVSGFMFIGTIALFVLKGYIKMIFFDKMKIDKKFAICFGVLLIYLLLPFSDYNDKFLVKFVVLIGLVLIAYLMSRYPKEFRIKINVNILALSLLVSIMCFATYFISDYLKDVTIMIYTDEYIRFQALLGNPNVLAMICEICLAILLYFILTIKVSWVEVFSFVVFAIVGISTFSKTFLLLLVLMLLVLIVYLIKKHPFCGLCVVSFLSMIVVLVTIFKSDIVVIYGNRFVDIGMDSQDGSFEGVMDTITTHRYGLWISYLQYMFQYPITLFFGNGLGTKRLAGDSPHNLYISLLFQLGIVGVILLVTTLVLLCKAFKKRHPLAITKAIFIPLLIFALLVCVEDLFMFIYA